MESPVEKAWLRAAREYGALDEEARSIYWQRLTPDQRVCLMQALNNFRADNRVSPEAVRFDRGNQRGCTRFIRHTCAYFIAPFVAAIIASAFAEMNVDFAFYLALAVAYLAGLPAALPLVIVALALRLRNPLWYLGGGALAGLLSWVLLLAGIGKLAGTPVGNDLGPDESVFLVVTVTVIAGVVAGAVYYIVAEWTPFKRR
jgi:hypothetical protein